jgi:hypothetical protein
MGSSNIRKEKTLKRYSMNCGEITLCRQLLGLNRFGQRRLKPLTNLQSDEVKTASDMEKLGWIEFREGGFIQLTGKGNAQFRLQFGD